MAEHLAELAIVARERKTQPGMDAPANLDHAADRFAPLQRGREAEGITFPMSPCDFGKAHTSCLNAEDLTQTRSCNPEPAFACFVDFNDGDTGQSRSQRTRIYIVPGNPALAIATRLPVLDQHLLGIRDTRKNILLTHNSPPPR